MLARTLWVGGQQVQAAAINAAGARKTRLNSIIAQSGVRQATPQQIRARLTAMASQADARSEFETMRHAIFAAAAAPTALHLLPTAERELAAAMSRPVFKDFPRDQAWRLLIDAKHHARGKYGFESEAGYMAAMMRAFTRMLRDHVPRVTADYYRELHDMAVADVLTRSGQQMATGFRNSKIYGVAFRPDADTWSQAGYDELVAKYNSREQDPYYGEHGHPLGDDVLASEPSAMVGPGLAEKELKLKPLALERCRRLADWVLRVYYEKIEKIKGAQGDTQDARLTAIVRCCQDLDQLHLFFDGNIRTIVFLLMNKLLMDNGLLPTIMDEPNILDCKSVAEIKQAVLAGQARFKSVQA